MSLPSTLLSQPVCTSRSSSHESFLGRRWLRRRNAARRKTGRKSRCWALLAQRSEWLEDRTLLAAFNPLAATADGAVGSLRDAIVTANSNSESDTITLESGTYTLDLANSSGQENLSAEGDLDILSDSGNSLVINGAGAGVTIISQTVADRVFHILSGANVTFSNLTISGGDAVDDGSAGSPASVGDGNGGGILAESSAELSIDAATITGNFARGDDVGEGGGGIFNQSGTVTILNGSSITSNTADGTSGSGGGIFNADDGTLQILDSSITGNVANRAGGGIEDNSGQFTFVELTNVTLDSNTAGPSGTAAPGNGGGLHVTGDGFVDVVGGSVSNNTAAAEGGGLWNNSGDLSVTATTISGNSAAGTDTDQGGGGIFNAGGNVDLSGVTLGGNSATSGFGPSIFNEGGTVSIAMSTVGGDIAGGDLTDDSFNIFESSVNIVSQGGTDSTTIPGDGLDNTFTIAPSATGAGATVTQDGTSVFTIDTDSETLQIDADLGDDSLTVDFGTRTELGTVTTLALNGDDQTSTDSLTLTGSGTFSTVTQTETTAVDGSFEINGSLTIDYSSIESITNELLVGLSLAQTADQTIAAGGGPVDIVISSGTDDGAFPTLSTGALPSYASFQDRGNGTGILTLDPQTSDSGDTSDITITATTADGSAMDTFAVNVVDPEQSFPNNTIYSINSAGSQVGDFARDAFFNVGLPFGTGATIDVSDASIPVGTPSRIFQTTRFDVRGGAELRYSFPTDPGDYEVTLFFAEIYSPVFRAGGRVFDVSIEGNLVLDDFDVFVAAGAGNKGIARTFNVTSDGSLDVDFGHVIENPMVMGLQIVDLNPADNAGPVLESINPVALESGQSTTVDVSATDADGDLITLTASGLPAFASFTDNGDGSGTVNINSAASDSGVFTVGIQASSGIQPLTDSTSFQLNVAQVVTPPEIIRINGGGPAISSSPDFVRDDSFQNGVGLDFATGATIDVSDDSIPDGTPTELFNTVTFDFNGGRELEFDIATQHIGATYEVTLYFAEIYGPVFRTGARIFDVSIDGVLVLDDYDIFAVAGAGNRGVAEKFQVVSDGILDIDFGHVVENPAIAGIEVRQIDQLFSQMN